MTVATGKFECALSTLRRIRVLSEENCK